jgi:hypothetical protein
MGETVNLNRARKAHAKAAEKAQAAENRVRFGRTKAEKSLESAREAKAVQAVEGHKRER